MRGDPSFWLASPEDARHARKNSAIRGNNQDSRSHVVLTTLGKPLLSTHLLIKSFTQSFADEQDLGTPTFRRSSQTPVIGRSCERPISYGCGRDELLPYSEEKDWFFVDF